MKKNIFCVPIFEFDVDLNYINVPASEEHFAPTWESKVQSTFRSRNLSRVPKDTVRYLTDKIVSCLRELEDPVDYIQIENIWKNKYDVHDFQGYHTHSNTTWSFIIYETVQKSQTRFISPYMNDIQNQTVYGQSIDMPTFYKPELGPGSMILFPSWVGHQVLPGNEGTTISGNVKCFVRGVTR